MSWEDAVPAGELATARALLAYLLDQEHGGQPTGLWKGDQQLNWAPARDPLLADFFGIDLMTGQPIVIADDPLASTPTRQAGGA